MLIKRNLVNLVTINGVRIYPGINNLNDAQVERVKDHQSFKNMLENGTHALIEKPVEDSPKERTDEIAKMSVKNAISVIKETHLIENLEKYSEEEKAGLKRKKVLNAIEDKIEDMKKIPEKDD